MTEPASLAPPTHRLATVAYAVATAVLVWASLRGVWGTLRFDAVMAAGTAVGIAAGLLALATRRRAASVAVLVGGYVATALALAIPGVPDGADAWMRALRETVLGPVTGWKDVVTLPTPLGEYGATLVPPLALAVLGTYAIVRLGAGSSRRWGLAAVVAAAMLIGAIAVGPASRVPLPWPPVLTRLDPDGLWSAAGIGLMGLATTLAWFRARAAAERRAAVAAAGRAGQARAGRARLRAAGRAATAAALAAVAVVAAVTLAGPVSAGQPREVARTLIEPRLVVDATTSPLAAYRVSFADESFNAELLSVVVESGNPARIRVATLPFYDGRTFSASAPAGYSPLRFRHLPSPLAVSGDVSTARITVAGLGGPWAPVPGLLGSVAFDGPRAAALTDTFYYAAEAGAAVVTADGGIAAGDVIIATAANGPSTPLEQAGASPGRASISTDLIPDSLRDWVDAQDVTRDAAGLAQLVQSLRARGYLSHALGVEGTQGWTAALDGYELVPAAAGHSYDRIDRMFTALNAREDEVGAGADATLVAAVGDDEQFAAAAALVAAELGFPARVVLGFRLQATDADGWTPPPCEGGVCRGGNLSAWVEVQAASGEWIAVDVTPQHTVAPDASTVEQRDPEHPTATDPRRAQDIEAVAALKGRSADDQAMVGGGGAWLSGWARTAAVLAGVLLLLLALPAAILIAKAARRGRRRRGTPAQVAEGGWEEYVDGARDAGQPPAARATRHESALVLATAHGAEIAAIADRATFTSGGVSEDDARRAWTLVEADRVELRSRRPWWRRLGTRLSTRSLLGRSERPSPAPSTGAHR
ncbi:transglutaminase domain-containing protein [Demequina lignilytica]|uniref:Transglutaminase domain-containing protein n=1 Tax=Demequina lignilytica TaxID=3051663 RepID=A0AB35MHX8_9MICO|nr:transglutaminase domain-containing protein [Demequina sp. SYSU T0a273]MDN4483381.1 transglutaminase domain-containing protein [Demequina sp. SYSU T0a273]